MAITDDAVRERHGVRCTETHSDSVRYLSSITVWESDDAVLLDSNYHSREMTAYQARYLAAKLYRLSRRIRQRTETAA